MTDQNPSAPTLAPEEEADAEALKAKEKAKADALEAKSKAQAQADAGGKCTRCAKKFHKAVKLGQNFCCPYCGAPTHWKK